jgi:hypothetical protein
LGTPFLTQGSCSKTISLLKKVELQTDTNFIKLTWSFLIAIYSGDSMSDASGAMAVLNKNQNGMLSPLRFFAWLRVKACLR